VYRPAPQAEIQMLPPALSDLIPEKDICSVISAFVDALPRAAVEDKFPHTVGAPPLHPRLMLKVLLHAYAQGLRSSRKIARACLFDITFRWLSCGQQPSHNTVNRFRSEYLRDALPSTLAAMAEMLIEQKYIGAQEYFVDGTIIDADANKHSHVWRKNIARYKQRIQERAREILAEAAAVDAEEDAQRGGRDLPASGDGASIAAVDIRAAAKKWSDSDDARREKASKALEKEAEKMEKYEAQEATLGERNSYSKTDEDATFMRTKDDLLRPAYNVQAGVQDDFVTGVSVSQNANDGTAFLPHLEARRETGLPDPPRIVADSIYGTEENYAHLEQAGIDSYLQYPSWHREQTGQLRPYEKAAFAFDSERDQFVCSQGKALVFIEEQNQTTKSGYKKVLRIYECQDCSACPVKSDCAKGAGNRRIQHSLELARHQSETRARLLTPEGAALRKKRGWQIETVWAHLKRNLNFRRFSLRGLGKATVEMYWLSLSHNLTLLAKRAATASHTGGGGPSGQLGWGQTG